MYHEIYEEYQLMDEIFGNKKNKFSNFFNLINVLDNIKSD